MNEAPTFRSDQMPYGGVKDSGNTREGPAYAVREMTEERLVVLRASLIGLVLVLAVVAIVATLVGAWFFGVPLGLIAVILFVRFVLGIGRERLRRGH